MAEKVSGFCKILCLFPPLNIIYSSQVLICQTVCNSGLWVSDYYFSQECPEEGQVYHCHQAPCSHGWSPQCQRTESGSYHGCCRAKSQEAADILHWSVSGEPWWINLWIQAKMLCFHVTIAFYLWLFWLIKLQSRILNENFCLFLLCFILCHDKIVNMFKGIGELFSHSKKNYDFFVWSESADKI